jgi:isoleucyl-tRNA synthetase
MRRVPDILDVWIDSGSASWNCLDYPQRKDLFERFYPADFILEGIDQIRGWFNLLFVASMVSMELPSFKAVYMHGFVQDSQGRKMSKSLGNYILPQEVVDKYGADTLRYYMIGGSSPGVDINYNFEDMKTKNKNLHILWNLQNFVLDIAKTHKLTPGKPSNLAVEEKYILSRMHSTIKKVTEKLDGYYLNEVPSFGESLFLELSRVYIQLVRDKVSAGTHEERQAVFDVAYEVLMNAIRMFSVTCPFITEEIYLNLKDAFNLKEESIFLMGWPSYDGSMIDPSLEEEFGIVQGVLQTIMHLREKISMGSRWPLPEVVIASEDEKVQHSCRKLIHLIEGHTNVKKVTVTHSKDAPKGYEPEDILGGKVYLSKILTPQLEAEGYANELMRRIQNLRKNAKLQKTDAIELCIVADPDSEKMLKPHLAEIAARVGARKADICGKLECRMQGTSSVEKIKGKEFTVCFEKV